LLTCHNVRHAHSSICTVHDNADRMQENAKCLYNIKYQQSEAGSVCVARLSQYAPDQKLWM